MLVITSCASGETSFSTSNEAGDSQVAGMPSFGSKLTAEEIQAVAAFVASSL
ncbi:MAG: mono/diheme cytochrome c family protein [Verrucomicrobiales bacterium]